MPSLTDFVQPPPYIPGFELQRIAQGERYAQEDTGVGLSKMWGDYSRRALPDLVSNLGARGSVYSSSARQAGDRMREDVDYQAAEVQRGLGRTLSDFARQRIFANVGMRI